MSQAGRDNQPELREVRRRHTEVTDRATTAVREMEARNDLMRSAISSSKPTAKTNGIVPKVGIIPPTE